MSFSPKRESIGELKLRDHLHGNVLHSKKSRSHGKMGLLESTGREQGGILQQRKDTSRNAGEVVFVVKVCAAVCCSAASSCATLRSRRLQHARLPCPSPYRGVCSDSCPQSWLRYLTTLSSVAHFSFCLQSFSASGSFPVRSLADSLYWCWLPGSDHRTTVTWTWTWREGVGWRVYGNFKNCICNLSVHLK